VDAHERGIYGNRVWEVREGYDLVAPYYDRWHWRTFWELNEQPEIERLLRVTGSRGCALDVGCGTGSYTQLLEQSFATIGVDPSLGMLQVARRRKLVRTQLVCARASALPLRPRAVDLSVAARSLCHEPNLLEALRQIANATRPGGQLVISDVHAQHDYQRTRIPIGNKNEDVHIDTIKRTPQEVQLAADRTECWVINHQQEYRWRDLRWTPTDDRFFRLDQSSERAIFFIISMIRR
jgi:SAM-dependent methyltransferase